MSKTVLGWLGVLFLAMGVTILWMGYKLSRPSAHASVLEIDRGYELPPPSAGDVYLKEFTLTERDGSKKGTADLLGKVSVTNFFFSTCPADCMRQNKQFEIVQREYGPKGVQFVGITCDPDSDTPSRLASYARNNFNIANDGKAWWFLTGDLTYISRIAEELYGVPLKKYTHTEKFEVRDKWGNPRGSFSWKEPASLAEMKLVLDRLLTETEPPADVVKAAEERAALIKRAEERAAELKADMAGDKAEEAPAADAAASTEPAPVLADPTVKTPAAP